MFTPHGRSVVATELDALEAVTSTPARSITPEALRSDHADGC
jgi:hypothetical protein